jgi:putative spermidine/putrescine transport system permease protein
MDHRIALTNSLEAASLAHVAKSADRSRRREPTGWLQALPFAAVFVLFFVVPLCLVVVVSFWDYN